MMRVVLYTQDFEPVTVLELPLYILEEMERHGGARIAVVKPFENSEGEVDESLLNETNTLDLELHKLRWQDGTVRTILTTSNDELALTLRPDWLPGQVQAIQWYKKTIQGLIDQLQQQLGKGKC
jgi:hypothetical protein